MTAIHSSVTQRSLGDISDPLFPLAGSNPILPTSNLFDEGLKVRTFCLELFSTIDQVLTSLKTLGKGFTQVAVCEECRQMTKDFLEQKALEKKARYSDFLGLIEILQTKTQEFNPTLHRLSSLVELQKRLPKQKKWSYWKSVRASIFVMGIQGLAKTSAYAESIGLHPIPPVPKRQPIVNLYPTFDAINLVQSTHTETARWLMTRTRVFTFRELCQSIQRSCDRLRGTILSWDNYCLLSIRHKSAAWMANIGYRYLPLEKMPKAVLSLDDILAGIQLVEHLKSSISNHFILFEDAAYSGTQLKSTLMQLFRRIQQPFDKQKQIYCILGFSSEHIDWQEVINLLNGKNVIVQIFASCLVPTCRTLMEKELLSEEKKALLRELVGGGSTPLMTTEWKTPDYKSLPMFVSEGWASSCSRKNNLDPRELKVQANSAQNLDGIGPMPNVIPPYKSPTRTIEDDIEETQQLLLKIGKMSREIA